MASSHENSPPSLWNRIALWATAVAEAAEMDTFGYLDGRIAHLERRIATLDRGRCLSLSTSNAGKSHMAGVRCTTSAASCDEAHRSPILIERRCRCLALSGLSALPNVRFALPANP